MIVASASDWLLPLTVASVPALLSLGAAIAAARSARSSQQAEQEASRLRALEERLSTKKYEVYEPMLNLFGDVLIGARLGRSLDGNELIERMSKFATWVSIFGSDEAVTAYHNLMQGTFHDAPPFISLRLYADFVIAARRDMGDPDTAISALMTLGLRINDLYDDDEFLQAVTVPFDELCASIGWTVPWARRDV